MKNPSEIKKQIHDSIFEMLNQKVSDAKLAITSAKDSRDNDTKSSAGDKYETGRAMMQQEIDKNEMQLSVAMKQLMDLSRIDLVKKNTHVCSGSLVETDNGKYFIGIGLGKIISSGENYYAISLASPMGKILENKTVGEVVSFNGNLISILSIN